MRITRMELLLVCASVSLFSVERAIAGPYSDELSRCIIDSTSKNDRVGLVRWMFAAASLHPSVKSIGMASQDQIDKANKQIADLFTKLITKDCKQFTQQAVKYEGEAAINAGFKLLGEVAAKELFSSPEVAGGMAGLGKYFDENAIKAALETE